MMMSEAKALELGLPILARIRAFASVGVDPALMGIAPVHATRRCLERAGWRLDDVDLIEANEAFAAQAISVAGYWSGMSAGSTSTAARSPSATPSAPPAAGFWCRWCMK